MKTMNLVIEKYDKNLDYAFIFGAFGTIELLKKKKDKVIAIIVDPSFTKNEAFLLIKNMVDDSKLIIDEKLINKLKDKGNIFVIGVFKKYKMSIESNNHLILKGNFDEGSIGTIIRSMNGFEMKDLVLIDNSIDIFSNHLLRSTMGAFFNVNVVKYSSIEEYLNDFPNNIIYYVSNEGKDIKNYKFTNNYSLLFTNQKENNKFNKIKIDKDISLENIVNIVLYCGYN